jgi:hypothetical protein
MLWVGIRSSLRDLLWTKWNYYYEGGVEATAYLLTTAWGLTSVRKRNNQRREFLLIAILCRGVRAR